VYEDAQREGEAPAEPRATNTRPSSPFHTLNKYHRLHRQKRVPITRLEGGCSFRGDSQFSRSGCAGRNRVALKSNSQRPEQPALPCWPDFSHIPSHRTLQQGPEARCLQGGQTCRRGWPRSILVGQTKSVGGLAATLLALCKPLLRLCRTESRIFRGHPRPISSSISLGKPLATRWTTRELIHTATFVWKLGNQAIHAKFWHFRSTGPSHLWARL